MKVKNTAVRVAGKEAEAQKGSQSQDTQLIHAVYIRSLCSLHFLPPCTQDV